MKRKNAPASNKLVESIELEGHTIESFRVPHDRHEVTDWYLDGKLFFQMLPYSPYMGYNGVSQIAGKITTLAYKKDVFADFFKADFHAWNAGHICRMYAPTMPELILKVKKEIDLLVEHQALLDRTGRGYLYDTMDYKQVFGEKEGRTFLYSYQNNFKGNRLALFCLMEEQQREKMLHEISTCVEGENDGNVS